MKNLLVQHIGNVKKANSKTFTSCNIICIVHNTLGLHYLTSCSVIYILSSPINVNTPTTLCSLEFKHSKSSKPTVHHHFISPRFGAQVVPRRVSKCNNLPFHVKHESIQGFMFMKRDSLPLL